VELLQPSENAPVTGAQQPLLLANTLTPESAQQNTAQ